MYEFEKETSNFISEVEIAIIIANLYVSLGREATEHEVLVCVRALEQARILEAMFGVAFKSAGLLSVDKDNSVVMKNCTPYESKYLNDLYAEVADLDDEEDEEDGDNGQGGSVAAFIA